MLVITGGRQTGKTTEMIKLCAANGGYIVCRSRKHAARIMEMARSMDLHINFPLTFDEFMGQQYFGKGIRKFHIDDADVLLQRLTGVPILSASLSGPSKKAGLDKSDAS